MSSVTTSESKHSEELLLAGSQRFVFMIFGIAFGASAVAQWIFDPGHVVNVWYWVLVGPAAALLSVMASHKRFGVIEEGTSYLTLFGGSVAGCFVLALALQESWLIPASLLVVAMLLGFLAWFEQNAVGMSGALAVALLCASTAAANLVDDAYLVSAGICVMLLAAYVVLEPEVVSGTLPDESSESDVIDLTDKELNPPLPAESLALETN